MSRASWFRFHEKAVDGRVAVVEVEVDGELVVSLLVFFAREMSLAVRERKWVGV